MTSGACPFANYTPGADSALNASRAQSVPFAVLHRTQGTDSRGLGATRHHSTPGTFHFLVRAGVLYQFYPVWVRCSHAAGGNDGVGIEIEGYDGEPVADQDLEILGRLALWLHDTYGIPLSFYDGPRRQIDDSGFRGFVTHASIATLPKWQHADNITAAEWDEAIEDDMLTPDQAFQLAALDLGNPTSPLNKRLDGITQSLAALSKRLDEIEGKPSATVIDWLSGRFAKMFPQRSQR